MRRSAFVLLVVALAIPASARGQCGSCANASFGPGNRDFRASRYPAALTSADFDGDGILDVVEVGNYGLAFLKGTPGGNFAAPTIPATIFSGTSLVAVDVNLDGLMDLVVVEQNDVMVLVGRGDDTLAPPQHYSAGISPQWVAVADFNGDGWPDLAVTNGDASFALLTNSGDGAFGAPVLTGPRGQSSAILVADFNRDGKLDIYVVFFSSTGQLFLGNGDGTFSSNSIPVFQGTSGGPWAAMTVDLDKDGNPDLIFLGSSVAVAHGHGNGSFDSPQSLATLSTGYTFSVASADFNGDGWPDLIASGFSNTLVLILSDGAGGFLPASAYAAGPTPGALLAADFDRDGNPDAVVANHDSDTVTLFRGRPNGSLEGTPLLLSASASAVAKADFNGDGKSDLASGGAGVSIWLGDGSGGFQSSYSNSAPTDVRAIGAGDLRGIGKMDLVALSAIGVFPTSGKLWVFLGDGAGGATPLAAQDLDFPPNALWVGDLDGDGLADLVISGIGKIRVLHGLGNGTFSNAAVLGSGSGFGGLVVRDLSGDGKLDIAAAQYTNSRVTFFPGNGNGTFGTSTDYLLSGSPYALVAGDFNGDGKIDLLTGNISSNYPLSLLRGRGDGTFEPAFSFAGSFSPGLSMATADFSGDGTLDVAVGDGSSNDLLLMTGDGDGTFTPSARFGTAGRGGQILAGDWNGDGKTDLAMASSAGVFILLNTNCSPRRLGVTTQPGACAAPSSSFAPQPVIGLFDDGDNIVSCGSGSVMASLVPGKGTPGAALGGATSKPLTSGTATFTDLSVNLAGMGYELEFSHPMVRSARSRPLTVHDPNVVSISAVPSVCSNSTGNSASVASAGAGATYAWSIANGTITSGAGTSAIVFTAGTSGAVQLDVTVTDDNGCSANASRSLPIACVAGFFTVTPCRVADTRSGVGPSGGPALAAGAARTFPVVNLCGIPSSAKAVAINLAVVAPNGDGDLRVYPGGQPPPLASSINFRSGIVRANNAIIPLGLSGQISVQCDMLSGGTHFFFDVFGYFQ